MDFLDPLFLLAAASLILAVALGLSLVLGLRQLPALRDAGSPSSRPRVSVVIAARDEAAHVADAVQALLDQNYPDLELVVVDDRSTDGTGEILDRLAASHAALRVIHVDELPAGWLGKNHALQRGAGVATGELLLFTDADVMMRPDAVVRAVAVLEREGMDHVAVTPRILGGSAPAAMTVAVFLGLFSTMFRPWKARDPESRHHIGIGAFNLVRAEAYRSIDGHRSIALRPDDDVRLGRALKAAGFNQLAAVGTELVEVEWYPTLRAMARGLRKNAFAVVEYRLSLVAAVTLAPVALIFWPLAALFVTDGAVWWFNAAIVAVAAFTTYGTVREHRMPAWIILTFPLGVLFLTWIVWAAALRAVRHGTIEWRGTEYSLEELRGEGTPGSARRGTGRPRRPRAG